MDVMSYEDIKKQSETWRDLRAKHSGYSKRSPEYFCTRCGQPPTLTDKRGNKWCKEHQKRFALINWGEAHSYPLVMAFGERYAVGEGYDLWFNMCGIGDDQYIASMYTTIFPQEDEG